MIQPWMFFAVVWIMCAAAQWKIKTLFPEVTEAAVIFGWIILGFLGVGFVLMFTLGHPLCASLNSN